MDVKGLRIHFIGIGGIGVSSIANIALKRGAIVSGCDLRRNKQIEGLVKNGAEFHIGHSPDHITKDIDLVVYSAAIPPDSPEIQETIKKGIPKISRATMLARLMESKKCIAIAGSHGKTTTTWLVSKMLIDAGQDPTVMVGGNVQELLGNFREGDGEWFVTEVDESNGLINEIKPNYSIITNIDKEHLDHYSGIEEIKQTFAKYANNTTKDGVIIGCHDDKNVDELIEKSKFQTLSYGITNGARIKAKNVKLSHSSSSFTVVKDGKNIGDIQLGIPGEHNVKNALAAISLGLEFNIDFKSIRESMIGIRNVDRRFQLRGEANRIRVIDDYGHHPTEIKATLATAKVATKGKVLAVFQPHRYSRTKHLLKEFGTCFDDADYLVITEIYSANEKPLEGASGFSVTEEIQRSSKVPVIYIRKHETIAEHLVEVARPDDMIVLLGAGNIGDLADEILKRLQ